MCIRIKSVHSESALTDIGVKKLQRLLIIWTAGGLKMEHPILHLIHENISVVLGGRFAVMMRAA